MSDRSDHREAPAPKGSPFAYTLEATSGQARAGTLETPHGPVTTPVFMPVGTHGALKAMTPDQVAATGAQVVLANTYHLHLRPGEGLVDKLGGLHDFMQWPGPILTDSGGFQVFSLPKVRIDDRGARFRNEVTGDEVLLTPERSIEIQNTLGADIIMAFDECTPYPATKDLASTGVRRTLQWMERCIAAHGRADDQALFAIVQGSVYPELRAECAKALVEMDLPGYAIGGVSVGEGHELLCRVTEHAAPLLPTHKPRYLMGVGLPEDLIACVGFGVDMFDCVIPTRYARSATVFTSRGRIRLTHRRYRRDAYPIDVSCDCYACEGGRFTRAYLHHLFAANEVLSAILCSIHNVHFYQSLMRKARAAILEDAYAEFAAEFMASYGGGEGAAVETRASASVAAAAAGTATPEHEQAAARPAKKRPPQSSTSRKKAGKQKAARAKDGAGRKKATRAKDGDGPKKKATRAKDGAGRKKATRSKGRRRGR